MTCASLIADFNLQASRRHGVRNDNSHDNTTLFILQSPAAATSANTSSAVKVTSGELMLTCSG